MRTASLPIPTVAVITAAATIMALKAGLRWAVGDRPGTAALLTAIALMLLALLAATAAFHVRVVAMALHVGNPTLSSRELHHSTGRTGDRNCGRLP